eukprot:11615294-Heterocapsa_arctica.AAC.1
MDHRHGVRKPPGGARRAAASPERRHHPEQREDPPGDGKRHHRRQADGARGHSWTGQRCQGLGPRVVPPGAFSWT